ncbi:peptide chain release factor N(5)-glutamine methyltransferase [Olleya sp. YSTF-M6]|uniref:peptide chain release factor N(5)-glutamine methyltransferase n=1 Tax=Olleya sediminilitoris TaxID=2795739 RepID=A0ABS1WLD8_9FLAO|nr:peptide chain release factor N(5)-glutamine methyltransferase [Olleya sediminilitoris]MBL7559925.1 peptide chain release factor N(5)-glutamine methyltransferase [Olleya sediminilitoris]
MLVNDLKALFHNQLDAIYGKDEVFTFFFMLTEAYSNISRLDVALDINLSITKAEQQPFFDALEQLKKQQPIQYIIGETEFFGLPFKVNSNTLIPRPETEELVQLIMDSYTNKASVNNASILDVGTGSGCIAISLAKNIAKSTVHALDVSAKAIQNASENAMLNQVYVNFLESSILEDTTWDSVFKDLKFDTIVSNPPYVRQLEKQAMSANVLENEPHLALFVDDDNPLIFYKAITNFALKYLKPKGELFFEINEYLGRETVDLLIHSGFENVQLKQDFFGKDRMVFGRKK